MSVKCTIFIQKEENWYVATDITSGVASQGKTLDESIENLREALELYYEDNAPTENIHRWFAHAAELSCIRQTCGCCQH